MDIISSIINDTIQEHYKYLKNFELESTEREKNIAILKLKAKELQTYTEISKKYFDYKMEERRRLFKSAVDVLEKAIKTGDEEYALIAAKVIEIIHMKSPLSF